MVNEREALNIINNNYNKCIFGNVVTSWKMNPSGRCVHNIHNSEISRVLHSYIS